MSWLTYKDDDLKGHDIMTLHFINNEKLLLLHERSGGEPGPRAADGSGRPGSAPGRKTDGWEACGKTNQPPIARLETGERIYLTVFHLNF